MKLTKFEGTMEINGAQITVEFADGALSMKGVPGEWATALATHVGRFRPKLSYSERKALKKGGSKNGTNGVQLPLPKIASGIEVVHIAHTLVESADPDRPVKEMKKRYTKSEVKEAAAAPQPKHEDDKGSEPHTVSEPEPEAKSSGGPGRIAVAKQVSDIVDALIEDKGITDVEQLVVECQKLQAGGHLALARVTNLDDRVRRRAILAGLEA